MLTRPLRLALAAAAAVVVIVAVWFALQAVPLSGPGHEVVVTVHQGDSIATIASEMHAEGVIGSPLAFRLDTMIFGAPTVRAGSYEMRQHSSFSRVRSMLEQGPNVKVLELTAGLTLHEVALDVAQDMGNSFGDGFVKAAAALATTSAYHPHGSMEGLIGTGTYLLVPGESPSALLTQMTANFAKEAATVGLTPSMSVEGLDAYQIVIAASIVEKEGYYPVNMPDVARVIFNRLARGGPLQMDSTVLYYYNQDGGRVTPAMLQTDTPYNTYLNNGLTPTPICTVSSIALHAVLHAPAGPWLYFTLISKDGTMAFSSTFAQQLANEKIAESRGIS